MDPMDQGCLYGDQRCPHMQGSRVPSHSFFTFCIIPFLIQMLCSSKYIQLVTNSIIFMFVINKFGSYFRILFCRVRYGIEKITFYLQNLISIIKKLLFTQTMLKKTGEESSQ